MTITAVENLIRRGLPRLQGIYDLAPHPFRNLLTSARGYVLTRMRYSPQFWQYLHELLEREQKTVEEIEAFRDASLRRIVAHATRSVPFYRRLFEEQGIKPSAITSASDLPLLPVLRRETLRAHWQDFIAVDGDGASARGDRVRVFTSGTTGSGLPVFYDRSAIERIWAFEERQKAWAGILPREWRISFFGSRVVPIGRSKPPFWVYNLFERQIIASIFHLSDAHAKDYLAFLRSHAGMVLEGFPTVLSIVADFVKEREGAIPMKAVFTTGEPLTAEVRQKISSAFAAKVYDSYGMTEWVGLIQECEKGGYHLATDYGILEVLDDDGEAVPAGSEGNLVWTGLVNTVMPLIRYRIGDKGMWQGSSCPCGRPFPLVSATITRDSDYLVGPGGRLFSPRAINQVLKDKTSFKACQFVQHETGSIEVRVVPGGDSARAEAEAVRRSIEKLLGDRVRVSVYFAAEPLQRTSGKIPLIISERTKTDRRGGETENDRSHPADSAR